MIPCPTSPFSKPTHVPAQPRVPLPSNMRVRENQCLYFQLSTTAFSFMQPIFSQPQALPCPALPSSYQQYAGASDLSGRIHETATSFPNHGIILLRGTSTPHPHLHMRGFETKRCHSADTEKASCLFSVPMICARERE